MTQKTVFNAAGQVLSELFSWAGQDHRGDGDPRTVGLRSVKRCHCVAILDPQEHVPRMGVGAEGVSEVGLLPGRLRARVHR